MQGRRRSREERAARAAWKRLVEPADAALGGSPKTRLAWLLDFVQRDLAALSDRNWGLTWRALWRLFFAAGPVHASYPGWGSAPNAKQRLTTERVQLAVRGLLEDLAHGRPHGCDVKVMYGGFDPPARRPPGGRGSGRIKRQAITNLVELGAIGLDLGDAVSAAVLRTVEMLDEVGADRLRACDCGRLFLAVRRQRHCSKEHARQASWRAYITREGVAQARKLAR